MRCTPISKQIRLFILALFVSALLLPRLAAAAPAPSPTAAKSPAPAASPAPNAHTIFDYQKELGITEKQSADMKAALKDLAQRVQPIQAKLGDLNSQIGQDMEKEAPLPKIREKLLEFATLQVDMKMADIETARKINAILTREQLTKWRDIQSKARAGKS